jgi:hypothetical protein
MLTSSEGDKINDRKNTQRNIFENCDGTNFIIVLTNFDALAQLRLITSKSGRLADNELDVTCVFYFPLQCSFQTFSAVTNI